MLAYLIYSEYESKRNAFLVDKILTKLDSLGVRVRLLICEKISVEDGFLYDGTKIEYPDFVINRAPDTKLVKFLEQNTVVFNNSYVSNVANDKYKTFCLAKNLGISVLDTYLNQATPKKFPCVVKPTNGHGGQGVFLTKNDVEFFSAIDRQKGDYIVQDVYSALGQDTRVYVVFGKPVIAIKRTSQTDFRANFCLGGSASIVPITDKMREIIKKLDDEMRLGYVGVDFFGEGDNLVLNEIEDCVGARMVYTYSDIDIISLFMDEIMQKMG